MIRAGHEKIRLPMTEIENDKDAPHHSETIPKDGRKLVRQDKIGKKREKNATPERRCSHETPFFSWDFSARNVT